MPVAVVEAKKLTLGPQNVLTQADHRFRMERLLFKEAWGGALRAERGDRLIPSAVAGAAGAVLVLSPALFYAGRIDAYLSYNVYSSNKATALFPSAWAITVWRTSTLSPSTSRPSTPPSTA